LFCGPPVQSEELFRPLCIDGACLKWAPTRADGSRVLTWAIARTTISTEHAYNCGQLREPTDILRRSQLSHEVFRQALVAAFAEWQQVTNVTFVETPDQDKADIVVGEQVAPIGYAFTNVSVRRDPGAPPSIAKAQICLNPNKTWKVGYDGNLAVYDLVHTFAHEIGHAIGLDHPSAHGQLMSFRYDEDIVGLSEGDILGAGSLYGLRPGVQTEILTGATHDPNPNPDPNRTKGAAILGIAPPR
jgi:hypothetical protein